MADKIVKTEKPYTLFDLVARIATALEEIAESCDNDSEAWDAASCADHVDDAESECSFCNGVGCERCPEIAAIDPGPGPKGNDAEPECNACFGAGVTVPNKDGETLICNCPKGREVEK